jgi:hypothetical protein
MDRFLAHCSPGSSAAQAPGLGRDRTANLRAVHVAAGASRLMATSAPSAHGA